MDKIPVKPHSLTVHRKLEVTALYKQILHALKYTWFNLIDRKANSSIIFYLILY